MQQEPADFQSKAGLSFQSPDLLELALTHSSWTFEKGLAKECCNERLEFLGDAVLELCVSEILYNLREKLPEGRMTKVRSLLTREETLAAIARNLNLGAYLRMGRGELSTGGQNKASNLADAVEALIAAYYLDQGYEAVYAWLKELLQPFYEMALTGRLNYDYKSAFQELVQALEDKRSISYQIVSSSGPDHNKSFVCHLLLDGKFLAEGRGKNKKTAEQQAAQNALKSLHERE